MTAEEIKEIHRDVSDFISIARDDKSYCLTLHIRQGNFIGGKIEIDKPGGKNIRFLGQEIKTNGS